jgi:hypothetical protein
MERRYAFNWQESTLLVRASDYDALAQRLAEAERRIRAVQQKVSPDGLCNPGWQDALQELYDSVNADSADDGLLADRVHKDGKLYRERR